MVNKLKKQYEKDLSQKAKKNILILVEEKKII